MKELADHILDIVQNSIGAQSKLISLTIEENLHKDIFSIVIQDNGRGMSKDLLNKVEDPFTTTRTTRKIGLGIPLFKEAALMCGGSFNIDSKLGEGTTLAAIFSHSHIDRAPLGKIEEVIASIVNSADSFDLVYVHKYNDQCFQFDTREVREILGGVSLSTPEVVLWVRDYIKDNVNKMYGGAVE